MTVFGTIALVGGGVVAVRAVWVGSIAVSLDSACVCGASEARRSGIELNDLVSDALGLDCHIHTPGFLEVPTL